MQKVNLQESKAYFQKNQKVILEDFFAFLRFPSISTDPEYKKFSEECASWLGDKAKEIGFEVQLWRTKEHPPVIFASDMQAGKDKPTLLIYNHYDVQPVDPLELWDSSPFEPDERNGEIYARGAVDNKGQCYYVLQALKYLKHSLKNFPINIKWLIEGEEESGSVGLHELLVSKKDSLKADYLLIVDTSIQALDQPSITLGMRGIFSSTLTLKASKFDLHSGQHGGIAYNPNRALAELIAQLFDKDGRVTIPGFYDQVISLTEEERMALDFSFDEEEHKRMFGCATNGGEKKYPPIERNLLRPTLEINGIHGGYGGKGFKTVIPAEAFAKISCRLVPNQNPEDIEKLLKNYFESHCPEGMSLSFEIHKGTSPALRTSPNSRLAEVATEVFTKVFGKECKKILNGASIPIASALQEASESEILLIGVGLPDDQIHAPNEHFGKKRLELGFLILCEMIQALAK